MSTEYNIDFNREHRTGAPEVIYGEGKTASQIINIMHHMLEHDAKRILATRVSNEKYEEIKGQLDGFEYDKLSGTLVKYDPNIEMNKGKIGVICAGTSDLKVSNEACITAKFLGNEVVQITDVGVAGIHRLFNHLDEIKECNVLIVIAGMEGALASVIGGLVTQPIIAVPTSVGYGANFGGLSALLSMINSCATGISVVNIDNGFGGAFMAHSINNIGGKR